MHAAGGACIRNFRLMRCGDKIEEEALQQQQDTEGITLCETGPDGTDCVNSRTQAGTH